MSFEAKGSAIDTLSKFTYFSKENLMGSVV